MEILNLLNFINKTYSLSTLEYSSCDSELTNLLTLLDTNEQFTQKIDLGVVYLHQKTLNQYTIVDGYNRILSLNLLLHAICECYKKTSAQNEKAITTIRNKYLFNDKKLKLQLPENSQIIYEKIINGERLSGKEKKSPMFKLLHDYWEEIKNKKLQATDIFKMLKKISITIIEADNIPLRDLYYSLNKNNHDINQLLLIDNYIKELGYTKEWNTIKKIYDNNEKDIYKFFDDFFATKLGYQKFDLTKLYEYFINYFETMLKYHSEDVVINKIKKSAKLYFDILNVNFANENLKKALVQIKIHQGEDTYAYLLNIYEDYVDKRINESTILEIIETIDEYLKNRLKTPNNVNFKELIEYLNTFITCK